MRIVTSVNQAYLGLLDVWLRQSAPAIGMPVTVACMDDAARAHCAGLANVDVISPSSGAARGRQDFWVRRFDVIAGALEAGDVVHTDVDAFWLRSPWPMLEDFPDDLIFSREFGIPLHIKERWGFVLCCGFFMARSSDASRAFFALWRTATHNHMDDQRALNELLFDLGAEWSPAGEGASRCSVTIDGRTVSILALSHDAVSREPPYAAPDALIAHPYFERQFFISYVQLLAGLQEETGSVALMPVSAASRAPDGVKPRDVATFQALQWLLQRRPGNGANWAHLGALCLRLDDREKAAASFAKARELGVRDSWSLFLVGTGLGALGRRSESLAILHDLAVRNDLEPDLARRAAATSARQGSWMDAARFGAGMLKGAGLAGSAAMAARYLRQKLAG